MLKFQDNSFNLAFLQNLQNMSFYMANAYLKVN